MQSRSAQVQPRTVSFWRYIRFYLKEAPRLGAARQLPNGKAWSLLMAIVSVSARALLVIASRSPPPWQLAPYHCEINEVPVPGRYFSNFEFRIKDDLATVLVGWTGALADLNRYSLIS